MNIRIIYVILNEPGKSQFFIQLFIYVKSRIVFISIIKPLKFECISDLYIVSFWALSTISYPLVSYLDGKYDTIHFDSLILQCLQIY